MSLLGHRRRTRVADEHRYWRCTCGSPDHWMTLGVGFEAWDWNEEGHTDLRDYGELSVEMAFPWMPWRQRLGKLWEMVRGHSSDWGWVSLSYGDAVAMREHLDTLIAEVERRCPTEEE